MTRDMYDNMAKVHVEGESKVTWRELELAQKEVRNNGRALTRVFGLGKMKERGTGLDALTTSVHELWMPQS